MAGTDASDRQAVWQPGGAEEDNRLREGNRHLHLAYDKEEEATLPGARHYGVIDGTGWPGVSIP